MAYQTIKIKKYSDVIEEFTANGVILPGQLVEQTPAAATARKHATSGGNAIPMFALEDELQGKGIDDSYASGDKVQVWIAGRGDIVYACIADEQNIAIGDPLESNGDGMLQKHTVETWNSNDAQQANTVYSFPVVALALEAKNLSTLPEGSDSSAGGAYYHPRIKVRIV
jgi:hypothetical protein